MSSLLRVSVAIFTLILSSSAHSQSVTAEQALANARQKLQANTPKCKPDGVSPSDENDEIVVCSGRSIYALPLPDERGPPEGPKRAQNDVPSATSTIPKVCPSGMCGGVNLFKVAGFAAKALGALIKGED